jgi:uncharacterized protein (DUF1330 family)
VYALFRPVAPAAGRQPGGKRNENRLHSGNVSVRRCRALRGLHAQAKPKAYVVSELETLDPAAQAVFTPLAQAAQKAAGGRPFITGGGKVVGLEGAPPPKRVVINEFDSLDQAEAYYKSKAWNDLAPQRDKAIKTIRRYAVEATH